MAKVAIVGGGAAGMGAAVVLAKAGMDVALFEAEPQLGGHCFAVSVSLSDRTTIRVDAGVCDLNPTTSGGLCALMDELDLRWSPANHDVSFMMPDRAVVWFTRDGQSQFRRPIADQQQLLDEIERFNRTCIEVLDDATYAEWSARRYLDDKQYSPAFRKLYFEPRVRGSIPPHDAPDQCPIRGLVASWRMYGIVDAPANRMVVQGGMHLYGAAVERWLRQRKVAVHLATRVIGVGRQDDGIRLRAIDRDKANLALSFDHVIIATNADQVIPLLEDAAEEEAKSYSTLAWRRVRLVVHQDPQLMPADRGAWAAHNYVVADDRLAHATVTIYPNRLQNLPASVPDVFVTLDPLSEPDADKIIVERFVMHSVIGKKIDATVQRLDAMQGKRRTWFCGGYLREPFVHEQAYRSGVEIARRLLDAVGHQSMKFEAGLTASPGHFDDFLREIPLFAQLEPRALAEVQLVARPFQAEAGTMLFRQGEVSDGLYLIKRGEVAITRRVPGDEVVQLAVRGAGAVVGEMSLLDLNPRSTHAVAATAVAGYFVSRERFQLLRSDYRPAAFAVMNCFRSEVAARARATIAAIAESAVSANPLTAAADPGGAAEWPPPSAPETIDRTVLLSLPFFRSFQPVELEEFVAPLRRFDFAPGQLVYAPGEAPRGCLVVVRGALALNFATAAGLSRFSVHGPGQIVGELPLVDGGPHPLACVAREATIAFEVDRIAFERMSMGGSVVAHKFFEAVTAGIVAVLRRASAHQARLAQQEATRPPAPSSAQTEAAACAGC